MDWRKISRIRLEDIRDKFIRSYFGLIVSVLLVLLILGVVLALGSLHDTTRGKQWRSSGFALAVMAALWIYRVWNRRRILGRNVPARRRTNASASRPVPHLTVTDFEPPDAGDWAGGRIEFSRHVDVSDRWFLTISITVVFALFGWVHYSMQDLTGGERAGPWDQVRIILLLAAAPVGFAIWAIAGTVRSRKTGVSSFQMNAGPGIIGRQLSGVIEMPANIRWQDALEIELICLRQDSEGECAVERTLVPKERPAIRDAATFGRRLAIPVSIPIPPECSPSMRGDSDECIRWVLVAKAPRSRYQAEFEVPVLKAAK